MQAEESVLESNQVQSTEVVPVVGREIMQVDGCVSTLDVTQTEISTYKATEVHTEQIATIAAEQMSDLQSEACNLQTEEVTISFKIQDDGKGSAVVCEEHVEDISAVNDVDTEENVSKVVEKDVQESEKVLRSRENESCSDTDNQTPKLTTEETMAETDVLIVEQETTTLQYESICTISNSIEFKDTQASTTQEEAKESEIECKEDKMTHSREESVENEVVTTDIPEFKSSEILKAFEPVTIAAVEEHVLEETIKTIEIPQDSIESSEVADTKCESNKELSKGLQVVVESISQKAAAIVDAAIEAATNGIFVDAACQGNRVKGTTISKKVEVIEEGQIQTIKIESCSTTIVQSIIETAVETVVSSIHRNETVSVQGQNLESDLDARVKKTVPLYEAIKLCPQLEDGEQEVIEGVKNTGKEIESAVPDHTRGQNEQVISTQASMVNAQDKAQTVES